jgi:hypothetical protein
MLNNGTLGKVRILSPESGGDEDQDDAEILAVTAWPLTRSEQIEKIG